MTMRQLFPIFNDYSTMIMREAEDGDDDDDDDDDDENDDDDVKTSLGKLFFDKDVRVLHEHFETNVILAGIETFVS